MIRCACGFVMPGPGHARDCNLYDPAIYARDRARTERPLLYVCAPFRTATLEETGKTLDARRKALDLGWTPVWGPKLLEGLGLSDEDSRDREVALSCDVSLIEACVAILVVGERITAGMQVELDAWRARSRWGARFKWPELPSA